MPTRSEVEKAVAEQDPESHLIVCNGDGKLIAERPGSGHAAALLVLEDGDGLGDYSIRPAALRRSRRADPARTAPRGTRSHHGRTGAPAETQDPADKPGPVSASPID